jgi:tRNA(fMet)-specific endonuclease VapC
VNRLVLDTTFLIDAERSRADVDRVIAADDDVAVAAVTIAELRVGVLLADGRRRDARAKYLDELLGVMNVLDYDIAVAGAHAELLAAVRVQGRPRGAHDLIIAATARAAGRDVVTADLAAFRDLPGVRARSYR